MTQDHGSNPSKDSADGSDKLSRIQEIVVSHMATSFSRVFTNLVFAGRFGQLALDCGQVICRGNCSGLCSGTCGGGCGAFCEGDCTGTCNTDSSGAVGKGGGVYAPGYSTGTDPSMENAIQQAFHSTVEAARKTLALEGYPR